MKKIIFLFVLVIIALMSSAFYPYSQYVYCTNNPVSCIDPSGCDTVNITNIEGKWHIATSIISEGNDVFNVNINNNIYTYTFSEGEYGNRMNLLILSENEMEAIGAYQLSGSTEVGYALQRSSFKESKFKRIPIGSYTTFIGEGVKWTTYIGLKGNQITNGIRIHYGPDISWSEGCILLSSDYSIISDRINFNIQETQDAVWNYVKYLGAVKKSLMYQCHRDKKKGKEINLNMALTIEQTVLT